MLTVESHTKNYYSWKQKHLRLWQEQMLGGNGGGQQIMKKRGKKRWQGRLCNWSRGDRLCTATLLGRVDWFTFPSKHAGSFHPLIELSHSRVVKSSSCPTADELSACCLASVLETRLVPCRLFTSGAPLLLAGPLPQQIEFYDQSSER